MKQKKKTNRDIFVINVRKEGGVVHFLQTLEAIDITNGKAAKIDQNQSEKHSKSHTKQVQQKKAAWTLNKEKKRKE
jgi:hypothetical protein